MGSSEKIKDMLLNSGIDFSKVDKEDMLNTCKNYNGNMIYLNCNEVINVINEVYQDLSKRAGN